MIQVINNKIQAVKLDIDLANYENVTPEDIARAVKCACDEIYSEGLFPVEIVTPVSYHEKTWVGIGANIPTHAINPGGSAVQGITYNRGGVRHSVCVMADEQLIDAIYVFCAPFSPMRRPMIEWPENAEETSMEENDDTT